MDALARLPPHVISFASAWCSSQVLPIERGAGLQQQGMQAAEDRLNRGDWVHVFPEGTRSVDGRMRPARRGIGRLVAACAQPPLGAPYSLLACSPDMTRAHAHSCMSSDGSIHRRPHSHGIHQVCSLHTSLPPATIIVVRPLLSAPATCCKCPMFKLRLLRCTKSCKLN